MISLRGLILERDENSYYGLIHKITDKSQIVQAPELSPKNNGMRFSGVDERGIHVFEHGLPKSGISRGSLYYYWHPRNGRVARLDAGSDRADLDCSRDPSYSSGGLGARKISKYKQITF